MEISTVTLTVASGTLVFVIGQVVLKMIIEPIQQFKRTIADISHLSVQYAHAIHNPDTVKLELKDHVFDKLRHFSGQLYGDIALIPFYDSFCYPFSLPPKKNVYKAAQNLIATANWMMLSRNNNKFLEIVRNIQAACDHLGLYTDPADRVQDENLPGK